MHAQVYDLAVRLLRGEIVEHADTNGVRWRASATDLVLVGENDVYGIVIRESNAYEVAHRFVCLLMLDGSAG